MKYFGKIGFSETVQMEPDIWEPLIKDYEYAGDINRVSTHWRTGEQLNDNLSVSMEISFIGDRHALENFANIRYATYRGTKWRVTNITENHPRIVLSLGGEYNDDEGSQDQSE